ncbi:transforming growth factor beta receptor type 3-like [Amphibalanus amphitrite]|uniref:transforming growth factor beta receptor type 3-like n=1 Tax=Amphibalanus amphitrite TaxID=1232801 RepID=UPI001C921F1E|nr:transforming growth factor beta receptor type 3-like [Amphibalanus amphitrite]
MPPCRLVCLWTVALALISSASASGGPELCVVKPLTAPDFSGEFHLPVPSIGCVGSCRSQAADQEVHTVRLSTKFSSHLHNPQTLAKATLNVRAPRDGRPFGRKVVLFLVGSSPVSWTVRTYGAFENGTNFQIFVSAGSQVDAAELGAVPVTPEPERDRSELLQHIVDQFGCVTSFTDVTVADLVDLTLGTDPEWPEQCDPDHLRPSPGLSAYLRQPVSLDGCYHRHLAGLGSRDVYVIEVAEQGRSFGDSDVTIQLAPVNSTQKISANITLLLKAVMPVTWYIETERFSGDLLVVTEDPVLNTSLKSPSVSLSVHTTKLPAAFSDLLLHTAVGYSSGPPVAYVRSLAVHRISIGLPDVQRPTQPPATEDVFLDETSDSSPKDNSVVEKGPFDFKRDMRRPRPTGYRPVPPSGALRRSLSVSCELGRLVVAVPAAEADLWHVDALRLTDPTCHSFRNATFLVISQPLDACLTRRRIVDGNAVYENTVHFISSGAPIDDEDFDGSGSGLGLPDMWDDPAAEYDPLEDELTDGGRVPVSCTHQGRGRPAGEPATPTPRRRQEVGLSDDGVDTAGYSLELFSDQLFSSPIKPNALVPVTHTIYVRASVHIVSAPDLRPVVEQCWISKDSDADAPYKFLVVRAACPVDGSVTFLRSESAKGDIFTFQVSRQYLDLGPYFLHCRVGLCARPSSNTSPRVAQCLDRLRYCSDESGGDAGRLVASGVQVVTRGPLLPTVTGLPSVPSWRPSAAAPDQGSRQGSDPPSDQGPLLRPGVEPETVAGIGVAAFVLGVTLMGGVWLIHSRIGPSKQHRFQAVPQSAPQEVTGQSAHSTPSSQTPIII